MHRSFEPVLSPIMSGAGKGPGKGGKDKRDHQRKCERCGNMMLAYDPHTFCHRCVSECGGRLCHRKAPCELCDGASEPDFWVPWTRNVLGIYAEKDLKTEGCRDLPMTPDMSTPFKRSARVSVISRPIFDFYTCIERVSDHDSPFR